MYTAQCSVNVRRSAREQEGAGHKAMAVRRRWGVGGVGVRGRGQELACRRVDVGGTRGEQGQCGGIREDCCRRPGAGGVGRWYRGRTERSDKGEGNAEVESASGRIHSKKLY